MNKRHSDSVSPISKKEITEFLDENDDFAFEMSVLRENETREIESSHSGTYSDPITKLPRQYDIRTSILHTPEDKSDHQLEMIKMAVECKNLRPVNPILISRSPRQRAECTIDVIRSVPYESSGYRRIYRTSHRSPEYIEGMMVGRSTSQFSRKSDGSVVDNDSPIYNKWAQAISSCSELIQQFNSLEVYTGHHGVIKAIVVPVVVVPDDRLWVIDYDSNGNRSVPLPAESCDYFIGKSWKVFSGSESVDKFQDYCITHLRFMTLSGYGKFLDRLQFNEDAFGGLFGSV